MFIVHCPAPIDFRLSFSPKDHEKAQLVEINLGCKEHDTEHTYRIYVNTFLGYGANEALARHRRDLVLSQVKGGEK